MIIGSAMIPPSTARAVMQPRSNWRAPRMSSSRLMPPLLVRGKRGGNKAVSVVCQFERMLPSRSRSLAYKTGVRPLENPLKIKGICYSNHFSRFLNKEGPIREQRAQGRRVRRVKLRAGRPALIVLGDSIGYPADRLGSCSVSCSRPGLSRILGLRGSSATVTSSARSTPTSWISTTHGTSQ